MKIFVFLTSVIVFGLAGIASATIIPPPDAEDKKVMICHIPPGNPPQAHALEISVNALAKHLEHGDAVGECF